EPRLKRQPQNLTNQKIVMQMMGSRKESSLDLLREARAAVADGTVTPKVQSLIKQLLKISTLSCYLFDENLLGSSKEKMYLTQQVLRNAKNIEETLRKKQ
ncbi:LOW QUALITY PROTEIN: hypothetical protein HID58_080068, partial [Brassica napus]